MSIFLRGHLFAWTVLMFRNIISTMLEIDGSWGEGGGQILRTALSLSCLLGRPFRIFDIRKGRKRPGLMPQHLTAVRASVLVSSGRCAGDAAGSTELVFEPGKVKPGDYFFDIGTAGSTGLLIQTLLPPLIFSGGQSFVTLSGGTHVPMSPPFHYISEAFLPMLRKLGADVRASIESYGFYPKGGGKVRFDIKPSIPRKQADFTERGRVISIKGLSAVGNLPLSIAERQREAFVKGVGTPPLGLPVPEMETAEVSTPGAGTFIFACLESGGAVPPAILGAFSGFSSLGERGKRAEAVGEEAANDLLDYLRSGQCLDRHMADQLVLYLSLIGGTAEITTSMITGHLRTNLWVIEKFLGIEYDIEGEVGKPGRVLIKGRGMPQNRGGSRGAVPPQNQGGL